MEKPNIEDYDINEGCVGCAVCDSERGLYNRDMELWKAQEPSYDRDLELWEVQELHQKLYQAQQADNFWMVVGGPSSPRVRHKSYELAHNEAKRRAEKQPGTTFYVVRPVDKVLAEPPQAVSMSLTWGTTK